MVLNPSNSNNLEQLALKGLTCIDKILWCDDVAIESPIPGRSTFV